MDASQPVDYDTIRSIESNEGNPLARAFPCNKCKEVKIMLNAMVPLTFKERMAAFRGICRTCAKTHSFKDDIIKITTNAYKYIYCACGQEDLVPSPSNPYFNTKRTDSLSYVTNICHLCLESCGAAPNFIHVIDDDNVNRMYACHLVKKKNFITAIIYDPKNFGHAWQRRNYIDNCNFNPLTEDECCAIRIKKPAHDTYTIMYGYTIKPPYVNKANVTEYHIQAGPPLATEPIGEYSF